jgi:glycosyltransferase 2 family protein
MNGGKWKLWVGIAISAVCLWFLFRQMDPAKLLVAFRDMDWRYLPVAIACTFVSYFFRAVRWLLLLSPIKRIAFRPLYAATIIGYMANNILPARLGELARAYVLAQQQDLRTTAVFATLVIDRLWDGFTVLVILVITLFTIQLPPAMVGVQQSLSAGGYVMLTIYLVVMMVLFFLKRFTGPTRTLLARILSPFPAKLGEMVLRLMDSFVTGLKMGTPAAMVSIILSSAVIWFFALLPVDLVLHAFGISLPLSGSMLILVFLVFAVMVPASPGFIGTYHAACVYGLKAFDVPLEKAMSIALVMHGIGFFPVILVGMYYLAKDRISLAALSGTQSEG